MRLLAGESRVGLLLRGVVLAAPVLALVLARPGDLPPVWLIVVTALLSTAFAALPESALGAACLALVVLWWALAVDGDVPATAIPAAVLLLAAHLAALLLSYGPPGLPIGGAVLRRWLRRGAAVGAAAPLVWLVAMSVDGRAEPSGIWVMGLAVAVAAAVLAAVAVHAAEET